MLPVHVSSSYYLFFRIMLRDTHEQKYFHKNLTLPKSTEKCWLERHLNSHLRDTGPPLYMLSYRVHRDWRRVFIQIKRTRYSRDNLTLIHERRVQIPLESTFFSWLRQCQIIMKIFLFVCIIFPSTHLATSRNIFLVNSFPHISCP